MTRDASGVEVRSVSKPPYTYFYALDGVLRQVNFDGNGDGKDDAFAYYSGGKTPDRLEVDEDRDGKIDLWEQYSPKGVLLRYATSKTGSPPDTFVEVDPGTRTPTQVETDADHDGKRERLEVFVNGRLSRAEIDTDGDGKRDRIQIWTDGVLTSEEIDRDGDGRADVRITRDKSGAISKVEPLGR